MATAGAMALAQACAEPQAHFAALPEASTSFDAGAPDTSTPAVPDAAAQASAQASFGGGQVDFGSDLPQHVSGVVSVICYDDDILTSAQELDAGLDPCKDDTDGDGCSDTAEYTLGGCDDARKIVINTPCYHSSGKGFVKFVAPSRDAGNWAKLTLVADRAQLPAQVDLTIAALSSDGGVSSGESASFLSVAPGAVLRFELRIYALPYGITTIPLRLLSETGQVIDRGTLVGAVDECPIVI